MSHGEFIWCDLSAHDAGASRRFYAKVFGWNFEDNEGYAIGSVGQNPVAGHYQMPQKFIDIGMPAFWMSYISVDDVAQTVELAQQLGAKVELGPSEFEAGGTFALIRDPLGAGFTVFSGQKMGDISAEPYQRAGHGLFVSDVSAIAPFYTQLFGWSFETPNDGVYPVQTKEGHTFYAHQIPDPNVRGKEEFWAVYFAVPSLSGANETIVSNGGEHVIDMSLPEGRASLLRDPDGGAFIALQSGGNSNHRPNSPWKAWFGLLLILATVFTNLVWPWAIFLAVWVIEGVRTKETYLFERVRHSDHKTLFWILMSFYAVLAVLCLPIWGWVK